MSTTHPAIQAAIDEVAADYPELTFAADFGADGCPLVYIHPRMSRVGNYAGSVRASAQRAIEGELPLMLRKAATAIRRTNTIHAGAYTPAGVKIRPVWAARD